MGQKESRSAVFNCVLLKRDELEFRIQELNKKCSRCFAQSTLNMIFAIKYSGNAENKKIWQNQIQINCFTALDGKIYRKTYNLYQFMKFYESFIQILEASEASDEHGDFSSNQNLMKMSIFQDSCCGSADDGQCIICFDGKPNTVLPCAHAYCSRCTEAFRSIDQKCCPLCRHPLHHGGEGETWVLTEKPSKETINMYLVESNQGTRNGEDSDVD